MKTTFQQSFEKYRKISNLNEFRYCTNVHTKETWEEKLDDHALEGIYLGVKNGCHRVWTAEGRARDSRYAIYNGKELPHASAHQKYVKLNADYDTINAVENVQNAGIKSKNGQCGAPHSSDEDYNNNGKTSRYTLHYLTTHMLMSCQRWTGVFTKHFHIRTQWDAIHWENENPNNDSQ